MSSLRDDQLSVLGVVEVLSQGELAALPDFVCVLAGDDSMRAVVRGDYELVCGDRTLTGSGVAVWVEESYSGLSEVTVRAPGATEEPRLPASSGVVLAATVCWSPAGVRATRDWAKPATGDSQGATGSQRRAQGESGAELSDVGQGGDAESMSQDVRRWPEHGAAIASPEPARDSPQEQSQPERTHGEIAMGEAGLVGAGCLAGPVTGGVDLVPDSALDDTFDDMFGATAYGRSPEDAAVRPPSDPAPTPPPTVTPLPRLGDHDDQTVVRNELRGGAGGGRAGATARAQLRLSTGQELEVDHSVLIGRAPQPAKATRPELVTLVVVEDPYVSATHVEFAYRDGQLTATDQSTNGTVLMGLARPSERLTPGVPTPLADGATLALSEQLSVTVRLRRGRR
ncbi:MAG: FHA domain-containing protein [Nocardioides sp.]